MTGKFINILKKPIFSILKWEKKIGFFKGNAVRVPHITQYLLMPTSKKPAILQFQFLAAMFLCINSAG